MPAICSMTGFAVAQGDCPLGHITVELRCVNSRFLDLSMRMPEDLRAFEPALRSRISQAIARGKFDCTVSLKGAEARAARLDEDALERYIALQEQILARLPQARPLTVSNILMLPGITAAPAVDPAEVEAAVAAVLDEALALLVASREREGASLRAALEGYLDEIEAAVDSLRPKLPLILEALQARLAERLDAQLAQVLSESSALTPEDVAARVRQEVTLYALKADVAEEMTRLMTHVEEARRVLREGGPVGRRLDFLMQEMNREANTLGSKAVAIEMTDTSLALKLVLEQIREQVQNLQ
ncbi:MAG: YicC family protein [Duodenibacillus sp.]|nr:YicC family protein [Duodenibacillus sp.]